MKGIHVAAFSYNGAALALRIASELGGKAWAPEKFIMDGVTPMGAPVGEWTEKVFPDADALIFVSACGIAVRAIAPFIKSKTEDPAVVVLDEMGRYVISLLSGHIGGANDLADKVARITGGTSVVTTATDVHGITAADDWAPKNNCAIENIKAVKAVSSELLAGHSVGVAVTEQLQPAPWPVTLWLRPKNLVIGIGCKKGISEESLKEAVADFLESSGVSPLSLCAAASIDLKKEERAIIRLAGEYSMPFITYSAEELRGVKGRFTSSARVESVTGVDNVCERAAVLMAGGPLIRGKTVYPGITLALARRALV